MNRLGTGRNVPQSTSRNVVLIGIGGQHGLSQSNSWIGSAGHGEPQPSSIDEGAAYVDSDAISGLDFLIFLLIFHDVIFYINDHNFHVLLRCRKDSVSTRIAKPVPLVVLSVSPRRPNSTNAAVPAMRFLTPVRHPYGRPPRPAGNLWRGRPI